MDRFEYVEITQRGTVLMRERSQSQLKRKLKQLKLAHLVEREQVHVTSTITNIKKPIGNIFEGSI